MHDTARQTFYDGNHGFIECVEAPLTRAWRGAFHVGSVSRGNLEETGMIHRRASSPGRGTRHSRFVFLLSVFTLVVSLMMPMLTLTASDAAAQGTPPNCDQGYVVSDDGTECVPADQQQQDQQQPQCAEGEVSTRTRKPAFGHRAAAAGIGFRQIA